MTIRVNLKLLKKLLPERVPSYYRGDRESDPLIDIENAHELDPKVLQQILDTMAEDEKKEPVAGMRYVLQQIRKVISFQKQPDAANREVSDLDDFLVTLKDAIDQTSPHRHWLYREMPDDTLCPVYIANINLERRYGRENPAHIKVDMVWLQRGKIASRTHNFFRSDISRVLRDEDTVGAASTADAFEHEVEAEEDDDEDEDKPKKRKRVRKVKQKLSDVLVRKKLRLETPALYEQYRDVLPGYFKLQHKVGDVMLGTGQAFYMSTYTSWRDEDEWNCRVRNMDEDEIPAMLVLDDLNSEKVKFRRTSGMFFSDVDDDDDEEYSPPKFWKKGKCSIPFQPYVLAFDLRRHEHLWVFSERMTPRSFNVDVLDKLVLPEKDKTFISTLMSAADCRMEDIVRGKSGGIFILSEGPPGTGKTLTAELYAEAMQRPLYTVQCSQLGIEPADIEKKLKKVLDRAQRWKAVFLMDEADVYIRSRGTEVQHNAIVGVMLRVIEYYSGLMFMTTNLSDIDDAVRSRATAHLVYDRPGKLLVKIWDVLSDQFGLKLVDGDSKFFAQKWPGIVGRDVKNLVKLAVLYLRSNRKASSAEAIAAVSHYLKFPQS